jgi:membrane protease YdiL (CAAX protease family)
VSDARLSTPSTVLARESRRLVFWLALVAVLIAQGFVGNYASSGAKNTNILYEYSTAVGDFAVYAVLLCLVLWIAGGNRGLLALRNPPSWSRALALAAAVLVGSYVAIAIILDPIFHGGREQGVVPTHWLPAHAGAYAANWFVVAAVAPFVEELTYRGLGYSLISARAGAWSAVLATGVLFAASHGLIRAFPELAVLGFALAWLRMRSQSVYPGMLVHAAFNSVALAYVFFAAR